MCLLYPIHSYSFRFLLGPDLFGNAIGFDFDLVAGDVDNDGRTDVVFSSEGVYLNKLLLNGTLTAVHVPFVDLGLSTSVGLRAGDLNGDNILDLVQSRTPGSGDSFTTVSFGSGNGSFVDSGQWLGLVNGFGGQLQLIDMNNDTFLDLIVCYEATDNTTVCFISRHVELI